MQLDQIVPWGRSFDEYVRMFVLSEADLAGRVLGCGDGPASFNAEMGSRGPRVVSVDPLYAFTADQIRRRIDETYGRILAGAIAARDSYMWTAGITSPEELGRARMAAMNRFLADYADGRRQGRYVAGALPDLPFADGAFDLALCSHLLFTYSAQLSSEFHVRAIGELCRVAREVRVFPLLNMDGEPSPHVQPVRAALARMGHRSAIVRVPYEFQRGGDRMLVVRGVEAPNEREAGPMGRR